MTVVSPSHSIRFTDLARRHGRRVLAVAVLLLMAAAWLWSGRKVEPMAEADRRELVRQDGRLFRVGATEPFTGLMVERYPDDSIKSRSTISNGVLHGVSEGWHPNGILQVREHFREGNSHGLRTKWYESGEKMSEVSIVAGKLHGTFLRWHENGTLAEQIELHDGDPDGPSLAYYPSGFLKARATLENGKLIQQTFWNDGEMMTPLGGEKGR